MLSTRLWLVSGGPDGYGSGRRRRETLGAFRASMRHPVLLDNQDKHVFGFACLF